MQKNSKKFDPKHPATKKSKNFLNFFQKPAFVYWLCKITGVIMVSFQDILVMGRIV